MKIKLDENLPTGLVEDLRAHGHDVDTVPMENLQGQPDSKIWESVQEDQRFLITQDLDFSDLRKFAPGSHCGILLLRLREPGRTALRERLCRILQECDITNWRGCFVVATDHKLRVKDPH